MRPTLAAASVLCAVAGTALAAGVGLRVIEHRAATWYLPRGGGQDPAGASSTSSSRAVLVLGHADTGTTAGDSEGGPHPGEVGAVSYTHLTLPTT